MPKSPFRAQELKDYIRARIIRAELSEGSRIDARELKNATGATIRSVHQALNELAAEGVLVRRQRIGTVVAQGLARSGNAPLPAVRALAFLTSVREEVIKNSRFMVDVLEGMRHSLSQPSKIEFCMSGYHEDKSIDVLPTIEPEVLKSLIQGIVAVEANNAGRLNQIVRAGLPVVAVDYIHDDAAFDSVSVNHFQAGFLATEHLIAQGHRRIAFIGEHCNPNSSDPSWQERMAGYLHAMAWSGGAVPQPLILGGYRDHKWLQRDFKSFHTSQKPTAYVLCSSGWAVPVSQLLQELKLNIPQDISITCADAEHRRVDKLDLSYTRGDYEQAGRLAVQMIAARIACRATPPVRMNVPVIFVPGDSSRVVHND